MHLGRTSTYPASAACEAITLFDPGRCALEFSTPRAIEQIVIFVPKKQKVESVFNEMDCSSPVIYLLSAGADPTDSIEGLARKKKTDVACVSMGEVMPRAIFRVGGVVVLSQ